MWRASAHVYTSDDGSDPNPFFENDYPSETLANAALVTFWADLNLKRTLGQFYESSSPPDGGRHYVDAKSVKRVITYVQEL